MEAYLLHDANAGSNLKLMIMIQEEGMKGYGIYWTVLEFLRLQNEYKASLKVIPILAQKARVTTATLKRIIYDYALFEVNETSFSSPGLSRRMEPWDAQQEAKKEAGRRGGLVNQQRIRAVSYTHLDVYKRQVLSQQKIYLHSLKLLLQYIELIILINNCTTNIKNA